MADMDFELEDDLAPEAEERDDQTFSMFGEEAAADEPADLPPPEAPPASAAPYTVLARKYRPRTFEDLIGQEAMVRTLTNAFSTGRIAHAFMLTGVRGVGKTTTARLLARALNYERDGVDGPSIDLTVEGRHDRAINEGRHIDVMELDAASHTGVDNMRDLLDGVRYAPVEARNKVYVIDEVHMLSKGAFNALLKTLEEPPPHAKFIFATTEIRKVPITILSRCQRFDLRRVEPEVLTAHLQKVCEAESAQVDDEGLRLIARAAEGSVRDALSLLDQAIVQAERGAVVDAVIVRDMLGLADRAATIGLFETVMRGAAAAALRDFRTLHGFGADPSQVVLDLLEHAHSASVAKTLGDGALHLPRDQTVRLAAIGTAASAGTLARVWQMLMRAHDEVRRAPDGAAAVEMALIRLCYAADLPGPEEALRRLQAGEPVAPGAPPSGGGRLAASGGGGAARAVAAPPPARAPQPQPDAGPAIASLDDLITLVDARRDALLSVDVARFFKPISFAPGRISFEPAPGAPADLATRISGKLKSWTGRPWMVAAESSGGGETLRERRARLEREAHAEVADDPFVKAVLETFPGAEIVKVTGGEPSA
jgi:DNA polymerase-3 subunit gamma/tau